MKHLVPLGDTGWFLWRQIALRSAGLPADLVLALGDPSLDQAATIRDIAADDLFREAVTWQNPQMVRHWLGDMHNRSLTHKRELSIVSYAQRYAAKNDTIGFFGPVAWAQWTDGEQALEVEHGPELLARRTVYFECWAIDALAKRLSALPDVRPWLRPQLVASHLLDGQTLHRPFGQPLELSPDQAALLQLCDGSRPVCELPGDALTQLERWQELGIVHLDLEGPIETWPERTLLAKLQQIGHAPTREFTVDILDELVTRRDDVAAAAGSPDRLLRALTDLDETFERLTDQAATRRPGQTYAGRTVVYEDTVRGVSARLGQPVMQALADPLALVLESARWLVATVAENFEATLLALFEQIRQQSGSVSLTALLGRATPYLTDRGKPPKPIALAIAEMQTRWARILQVPVGVARHTVAAQDIAPHVRSAFGGKTVPWSAAVHYSPDIMLAGEQLVLGELHLAANGLESRPFVEQHPDPPALLANCEADHNGQRIYSAPTKEWPQVNSRTYPIALLSPQYTYWCLHTNGASTPGRPLPSAGLHVHRRGDRLVVRSSTSDAEYPLIEVIGEQLSALVLNAFKPLAVAPHQPRLAIDRLVIARETWHLSTSGLTWGFIRDGAKRFQQARRWQAGHAIPMRAFHKIPAERKPTYVDFGSTALVDLLARSIRRASRTNQPTITITEMLPDFEQAWLKDRNGSAYTSELRLIVVDGSAYPQSR